MTVISPDDPALAFIGALDLDRNATGWVPRRLPAWTRPQIPDLFMDVVVQMPSGVRLAFTSDTTSLALQVKLTLLQRGDEVNQAAFDLLVDGALTQTVTSAVGDRFVFASAADIGFEPGEPTVVSFDELAPGTKTIEVWLPQGAIVEVRSIQVDDGASVQPTPASTLRRWVHHGSSISHCIEADTPTGTWPAIAAALAGVELINLGLAGNCMLDPFVARTLRDQPADVISLKLGINLVNADALRERTFSPVLHGFLDTVREGHPDTPLLIVSPIFCPSAEDSPGPTTPDASGKFVTTPGLEDLRTTCLTLTKIRTVLAGVVEARRAAGDLNLHYLDGLALFGADEVADLPDDLHPNAAGYARMGHRFAAHAFGPGGPLS